MSFLKLYNIEDKEIFINTNQIKEFVRYNIVKGDDKIVKFEFKTLDLKIYHRIFYNDFDEMSQFIFKLTGEI